MPRPSNPEVRSRLLAAGHDLVHARGFAASGVKDITDAAGVPKGSFYAYFPSKEAFAAAILEHHWSDIETRLIPILEEGGLAQERITRFFHALADEHEAGDFLLGCLIGNLSLELGGSSEPVRAELVRILGGWNEALTACVRSGQGERGRGAAAGTSTGSISTSPIWCGTVHAVKLPSICCRRAGGSPAIPPNSCTPPTALHYRSTRQSRHFAAPAATSAPSSPDPRIGHRRGEALSCKLLTSSSGVGHLLPSRDPAPAEDH